MEYGRHIPVLRDEVIAHCALRPGDDAIDCTFGGGGYTEAILRATAPDGKVLALDCDPSVHSAQVDGRCILVHASFDRIAEVANVHGYAVPRAIVADLGLSSMQLADVRRGFSFQNDGPLDMRFDPMSAAATAADLLATVPSPELERIIRTYGDERHARAIAAAIVAQRKRALLTTTTQLADCIVRVMPRRGQRIHPATKTFQALRIAVNDELGTLGRALPAMLDLVAPGGRVAIVSFHSLEDRIVKQQFKAAAEQRRGTIVTPRPVVPHEREIQENPRCRSAKLRVFERAL